MHHPKSLNRIKSPLVFLTLFSFLCCLHSFLAFHLLPNHMSSHKMDHTAYTYFDIKFQGSADMGQQILSAVSSKLPVPAQGPPALGLEYVGKVGELQNHALFRLPKPIDLDTQTAEQVQKDRSKQIVDALSAVSGVVHVDEQVLHQRQKRDEL